MSEQFRGKLALKISMKVNLAILVVMVVGTLLLVHQETQSLQRKLLANAQVKSYIGAEVIGRVLEEAIDNGVFDVEDAFDTDYVPIGNFEPPKYHTKYDFYLDKAILDIQDEFLEDENIIYAVALDINGYVPTHNSIYQAALTGNPQVDRAKNRTKRVFNGPVELKAVRNTDKGFLQVYYRDTGEIAWDVSSPIYVKGRHWGGFRIGVSLKALEAAKAQLMYNLGLIMGGILLVSVLSTLLLVNRSLGPVKKLAGLAEQIAKGSALQEEIGVTRARDEIGLLQHALNRLRLSMVIALKRSR